MLKFIEDQKIHLDSTVSAPIVSSSSMHLFSQFLLPSSSLHHHPKICTMDCIVLTENVVRSILSCSVCKMNTCFKILRINHFM